MSIPNVRVYDENVPSLKITGKEPVANFLDATGEEEMMRAMEFSRKDSVQNLRKELLEKAILLSGDEHIAGMILDPSVKSSFTRLCIKHDVVLTDLVECFMDLQKSHGIVAMLRHLPQVMDDVAQDAKSQTVFCQKCDGNGVIRDGDGEDSIERQCPQCKGRGEVRVPGDKDARNLVFEAAELKGKKGPKVAIQQNFGTPSHEDTGRMVQRILVP